jgi:hypothetical protein
LGGIYQVRKYLALLLILPAVALAQRSDVEARAKALRNLFIETTTKYKTSLEKLIPLYEASVKREEDKLEVVQRRVADGLMARAEIEIRERELEQAREKLADAKRQLAEADQQLAAVPDEATFIRDYKRAERAIRRSRRPPCPNWDVIVSRRQTAHSLTFTYKIVCR